MLIHAKRAFSMVSSDVVFDYWDEPVVRNRPDGTPVRGRPSRGFGDFNFNYAGKDMKPEPWSALSWMPDMKKFAEDYTTSITGLSINFDFCLAGFYPAEDDGIMFHSDTVPTTEDIVCSINIGAPRVFINRVYNKRIKETSNTSDVKRNLLKFEDTFYLLEDGDAIIFDGYSQMNSEHNVPKQHGSRDRINLTFRTGMANNG